MRVENDDKSPMKLLYFLLRSAKRRIAPPILAGIVSGACSTATIAFISDKLTSGEPVTSLSALYLGGLAFTAVVSSLASKVLLIYLAERFFFELQMDLCRQVLCSPLRRLEEIGNPRLLAALSQDVVTISAGLYMVPSLCINVAIVISCLVYLGWLSLTTLAVLLVLSGPVVLGYWRLGRRARATLWHAREELDMAFEHYRELAEGAKELKLHRRRRWSFFSQLLQPTAASYRRQKTLGRTLNEAATSWGQAVYFVFILVLFILAATGHANIKTLTGYAFIALYMKGPIGSLLGATPFLSHASVALQKIEALGLSPAADGIVGDSNNSPAPEPSWKRLNLVGVSYSYTHELDGGNFTLGPIDLTLQPGELIFLIGDNGSGKTTLVKLLTSLYVPEAGEIRMDGVPINSENREDYAQHFSVVFSNYFLFDQLLGLDAPDLDRRARDFLTRLYLDHKVTIEEGILSTTELSEGQRRRLALLTAYLEDRPIYIFDEWAAGQDPQFKNIFYLQILPELKARGKSVLVISHDDRYYHIADRIVKLDEGRIEYDGPVAQVLHSTRSRPI